MSRPNGSALGVLPRWQVENEKLNINGEGVQTFRGNEAWAMTSTRALPQSPSKEDLGQRLLVRPLRLSHLVCQFMERCSEAVHCWRQGEIGLLDDVPKGMLDAHDVWSILKDGDELRKDGNGTAEALAKLGVEGYGLSAAQATALLGAHSTVIVLQNELGTKRIGACAVPTTIADGSTAGWRVAGQEGDVTLAPRAASMEAQAMKEEALAKQARESHELTDAQRAARGLGLPPPPPGKQSGPGGAPVGQPWQVRCQTSNPFLITFQALFAVF